MLAQCHVVYFCCTFVIDNVLIAAVFASVAVARAVEAVVTTSICGAS
jgi:hypothetical protein